jgi:long-chain acyl-CoA synthetase
MSSEDDKTILDYFLDNAAKFGDRTFMTQPMGGGDANVTTFSFTEVLEQAQKMAGYFEKLGLAPKSQIAICSKNCAWWIIADLAIWMAGHVSVPVYPTLTTETTKYILEHSEAKLLFVGKLDEKPWLEMKEGIPPGLNCISFPLCPKGDNVADKKWDEVIAKAEKIKAPVKRTLDEMATIIYTSGSTGE